MMISQHRQSDNFWLVVYLPLWKIWKSVGMMTCPIYGKIKMIQTTNQIYMYIIYTDKILNQRGFSRLRISRRVKTHVDSDTWDLALRELLAFCWWWPKKGEVIRLFHAHTWHIYSWLGDHKPIYHMGTSLGGIVYWNTMRPHPRRSWVMQCYYEAFFWKSQAWFPTEQ